MSSAALSFLDTVLSAQPKIAVFDCDGTFWEGDSGEDFFYWSIDNGLVRTELARPAVHRYADYKTGKVGEEQMCGEMVTLYRQQREDVIAAAAEEFFRDLIEPRIFPEMQELTARLATAGCELWAVSSTNEWVVRVGAARFGIPRNHVLAACAWIEDGCVSERLLRVPTGEGKAAAIRTALGHPPDAAFGNSIHDIAMLELARRPYAVNPNPDLERIATAKLWTIFKPEPRSAAGRPRA